MGSKIELFRKYRIPFSSETLWQSDSKFDIYITLAPLIDQKDRFFWIFGSRTQKGNHYCEYLHSMIFQECTRLTEMTLPSLKKRVEIRVILIKWNFIILWNKMILRFKNLTFIINQLPLMITRIDLRFPSNML